MCKRREEITGLLTLGPPEAIVEWYAHTLTCDHCYKSQTNRLALRTGEHYGITEELALLGVKFENFDSGLLCWERGN